MFTVSGWWQAGVAGGVGGLGARMAWVPAGERKLTLIGVLAARCGRTSVGRAGALAGGGGSGMKKKKEKIILKTTTKK